MFESKNELESLTIAPVDLRMSVDSDFIRFVRDKISMSKTVLRMGKVFNCELSGHNVKFEVVNLSPKEGVVGGETEIEILSEPTPRALKYRIKCYTVKPGGYVTIPMKEQILWQDTAWRLEDGKQIPDHLVIWTRREIAIEKIELQE